MDIKWEIFLTAYHQAVDELKVKIRGIRAQFEINGLHSPIEFVTGRVKPVRSILDKMYSKGINFEDIKAEIQDLAGIRIMCQFEDDIKAVVELLRKRHDFSIVEEKDYITYKKPSGYRSYHLIISYPVQTVEGEIQVLVEIQIRTLAMNFWASIEHSLNYKYKGQFPDAIKHRLKRAAEAAHQLDEEMSEIKDEIQEAQVYFSRKKELSDDSNSRG